MFILKKALWGVAGIVVMASAAKISLKPADAQGSAPKPTPLNISGTWKGALYQDPGGTQPVFDLKCDLSQVGEKVSGTSRITIINQPQYFAVMKISGTVKNQVFAFKEGKVLKQNPEPGTSWCIKSGKLQISIKSQIVIMQGNWGAVGCSPGTIKLRK